MEGPSRFDLVQIYMFTRQPSQPRREQTRQREEKACKGAKEACQLTAGPLLLCVFLLLWKVLL